MKSLVNIVAVLSLLMLLTACGQTVDDTPADVVKQYFTAWNDKDYATMYSLVSDGFKKIEPTAATLESFQKEVEHMDIFMKAGKNIPISATTVSNDGRIAKVDYVIELVLNSGKQQFPGTYTLRKTDDGWKLIHPYGKNADLSEE